MRQRCIFSAATSSSMVEASTGSVYLEQSGSSHPQPRGSINKGEVFGDPAFHVSWRECGHNTLNRLLDDHEGRRLEGHSAIAYGYDTELQGFTPRLQGPQFSCLERSCIDSHLQGLCCFSAASHSSVVFAGFYMAGSKYRVVCTLPPYRWHR